METIDAMTAHLCGRKAFTRFEDQKSLILGWLCDCGGQFLMQLSQVKGRPPPGFWRNLVVSGDGRDRIGRICGGVEPMPAIMVWDDEVIYDN